MAKPGDSGAGWGEKYVPGRWAGRELMDLESWYTESEGNPDLVVVGIQCESLSRMRKASVGSTAQPGMGCWRPFGGEGILHRGGNSH